MMGMIQLAEALRQHDDYLIVAHEHPDSDSIGSMIAMYYGLQQLGKNVFMALDEPAPANISWSGVEHIYVSPNKDLPYEAVIVLDCHPLRTGLLQSLVEKATVSFNIDHHEKNPADADYTFIEPKQAATAMLVYQLFRHMHIEITAPIAQALYGGIVGDTGGFRHCNTSEAVLNVAAYLVARGAHPAQTANDLFETKSWGFMKLLGDSLANLQCGQSGRLVWMTLTHRQFEETGVDPSDADQFVQYARMVEGCEIAMLFRQVSTNEVRISFRSRAVAVRSLAESFGGGGHALAAGAKISGELDQIVPQVVAAASALLGWEEPGK